MNVLSVDFDWIMEPSIEAYNHISVRDRFGPLRTWERINEAIPALDPKCNLSKLRTLYFFLLDKGKTVMYQTAPVMLDNLIADLFAKPENQIFWCTFRGYTPYTKEALESQEWITWRDANHPTELALEAPLQDENMELRFPNVPLTTKLLTVNKELTSFIMTDPNGDLDSYIKQTADSVNQSVKMLNARK